VLDGPVTIAAAKEAFFAKLADQGLSDATRYNRKILWDQVVAFAEKSGLTLLEELDATAIDGSMRTWATG
jgi:hypothetical protein